MISLELKKLLFKNYMLFFIALFLIFNAIQITVYVNNTSISDYPYYKYYLEMYADCYQTKTLEIEELNSQYTSLSSLLSQNQSQYLSGSITKDEYLKKHQYLQNLKKSSNGFHIFYEQFSDAKINKYNLIDTYFWNAFVNLEGMEYWIVLLIIISSVLFFNVDKNSKFNDLQKSSINYLSLFNTKYFTNYVIITIVFVLLKVQKFLLLGIRYSYVGWNSPINSLPFLSNSDFDLSLSQFVICLFFIQYVGITSFYALSVFISLLIKKSQIAFFFENALVVLPKLVLNDQIIYSIPILGPLEALKYFYGSVEINYGDYIEHRFTAFDYNQVLIIILVSILMQIFFVCLSRGVYRWQKKEY